MVERNTTKRQTSTPGEPEGQEPAAKSPVGELCGLWGALLFSFRPPTVFRLSEPSPGHGPLAGS